VGLPRRTGFEDSARSAQRSGLSLLRASLRASRKRDNLSSLRVQVLVEPPRILRELAAEAVPVAIADRARPPKG